MKYFYSIFYIFYCFLRTIGHDRHDMFIYFFIFIYTNPLREIRSYIRFTWFVPERCRQPLYSVGQVYIVVIGREQEGDAVCPLYFINGRVWHRDRFASVSRAVRSSEMQDGCIGSDVTRGWPLFDREPHYVYFHEPASMFRQLQLSPIAHVKLFIGTCLSSISTLKK